MIFGLTGQIGAGKSTVAKILRKYGAVIVDADQIGRCLLEEDTAVKRSLVRSFGDGIVDRHGKINRSALAGIAFANEISRQALNRIVHPRLLKELGKQVKSALKSRRVVVIDAALLLEWGLDKKVDLVCAVRANKAMRLQRMIARGFGRADVLRRMQSQMLWSEFDKKADVVVSNSGNKTDLRRAITFIWKQIESQK